MTKVSNKKDKASPLHFVCQKDEIKKGQSKKVSLSLDKGLAKDIAIFNIDGKFYALSNVCAHKGGPLSEGLLEKYLVTCPWHGWKFDVRNGKSPHEGGDSVDSFNVKVMGDKLYIDFRPVKPSTLDELY
jgi:nitrite reductase/ring-hydroxylating ferredoxin subunit